MYNSIIKLIKETSTVDEYGDKVVTTSERTIFAELKSIGQTEFYQAKANGFKPELKFVIADYLDYQGEKQLKYQEFNSDKEETYEVIRTYRNGTSLEITCGKGVE